MAGVVVSNEDCEKSVPGRPDCTSGEFFMGTTTIDPESQTFGFHCGHWYEDEGCCYCSTDTVNLLILGGEDPCS